ncbi:hypothetical protein AAFC00_001957 [Neodothiora populina]|uniref:Histidine kinase n=1 Tax=Neodothiora populina TaxID=2781224 RepID=A0ABR3PQP0_9PEZI
MSNLEPRVIIWGEERRMIYNEACSLLFGQKHPMAMGSKAEEVWSESWSTLKHLVERAELDGKSTKIPQTELDMNRHGYSEETHWTLQMVPIIGPEGRVLGVLDEFAEMTQQVVSQRRREAVVRISQLVSNVTNINELSFEFLEGLEACQDDVPFAMLYTLDSEPHRYRLEGAVGLSTVQMNSLPASFELLENTDSKLVGACKKAWESGEDVVLQIRDGTLPDELAFAIPSRAQGAKAKTVCILPVASISSMDKTVSFLIISPTPRRPYDDDAVMFVHHLRDILTKSASAIVLPEEQRRVRQRFEEIETSLAQQLRATTLEAEKVEARFAKMSQMAPVGMYAIAPSSETVFWNDAYLSITGITKEEVEMSRLNPREAIHPDDRERVHDVWFECLETKQPFTVEYRLLKPWKHLDPASGEEIVGETWVLANAMPELDENGDVIHIQGWILDISERKDHERLRVKRAHNEQSEARFTRLAETAPLGMYLLHIDGKPIYLNDAYFDLHGFTRSDFEVAQFKGMGWSDRIADEDKEKVGQAWLRLVYDAVPMNLEYRVKKPWKAYDTATGTEMSGPTWLQSTAVAEMDDEGNPIAVQGFVTEISLKKFSERLLAERLEDALETKQQADRFIDMTSHEMRNPLSAILQSADGILTSLDFGGLPAHNEAMTIPGDMIDTVIDAAQTIILCAQHQKRIVDDILTLSKLDSNLLLICPDRVCPPSLLEKMFKMYEAELARSSVTATLILSPSYNLLDVDDVMLDSSRLLQVVINLFTNAIKFTQYAEKREVNVYLAASKTRPEVSRNGIPFIKARAHRTDQTLSPDWGSGEELYIQIDVEDSGRGLTDEELKLLFHRFQQASPKTYKQYGGSGLGLFISRELSELQGGQIGVYSQAGKGSTFSFYVKARRYVRSGPRQADMRRQTPSLLSSPMAYARAGSVTSLDGTASESGNIEAPRMRATSTLEQLSPPVLETEALHILIVEDNLVNQRVMAQQLRRLGCTVHLANHGVEALEFLHRTTFWKQDAKLQAASLEPMPKFTGSSDLIPLSIILMDLEMPVLGGLGCVKQIRNLQRSGHLQSHVPVIAVTANARSEQIAVAIDHGMDSVVTKPFRIPELVPQMQSLVARVRAEIVEQHARAVN